MPRPPTRRWPLAPVARNADVPVRIHSIVKLAVGLAGAGMISRHHLLAWDKRDDVRVVAIADPNATSAQARAREFGIRSVYIDTAAMLQGEKLDVLDVATPRETHVELVAAAIDHGLAVLCQKPLAPTLAEAQALAARIGPAARLMVHENWRFRPAYRELASWLADGRLGTLRGARMTVHGAGLLPDPAGRYPTLERQPFMAALDRLLVAETLIHHLDVLRWLLGPLTLERAHLAQSCPAVRGEDRATLLLVTRDGAPVLIDGDLCVHGASARAGESLELFGTRATIVFADQTLVSRGEETKVVAFNFDDGYQRSFDACISHFVDALRNDTAFETSPDDNLKTLALVEAAYEHAARTS